jgi:hypothetical protein
MKRLHLAQKDGKDLSSPDCEQIITELRERTGHFEPNLLKMHVLGSYSKEGGADSFLFLESEGSYYYLYSILEFEDTCKLVEFGYKRVVSLDEAVGYIDEIVRFGHYQINRSETIELWLQNPSKTLNLAGHNFYYESYGDTWSIESVTPYGIDQPIVTDTKSLMATAVENIENFIEFWSEPRDEKGAYIHVYMTPPTKPTQCSGFFMPAENLFLLGYLD